jgi:hypothetical protein
MMYGPSRLGGARLLDTLIDLQLDQMMDRRIHLSILYCI